MKVVAALLSLLSVVAGDRLLQNSVDISYTFDFRIYARSTNIASALQQAETALLGGLNKMLTDSGASMSVTSLSSTQKGRCE